MQLKVVRYDVGYQEVPHRQYAPLVDTNQVLYCSCHHSSSVPCSSPFPSRTHMSRNSHLLECMLQGFQSFVVTPQACLQDIHISSLKVLEKYGPAAASCTSLECYDEYGCLGSNTVEITVWVSFSHTDCFVKSPWIAAHYSPSASDRNQPSPVVRGPEHCQTQSPQGCISYLSMNIILGKCAHHPLFLWI